MTELIAAGAVGFMLALRWPVGVWLAGAFVVMAVAIIASGSLPGAILAVAKYIVCYNLGLVAGLSASEVAHRLVPATGKKTSRLELHR